jgi:hypothetical protein
MQKVVSIFKIFTTIFYFKFFELRKIIFGSVKVLNNLNKIQTHFEFEFEINLNYRRPGL